MIAIFLFTFSVILNVHSFNLEQRHLQYGNCLDWINHGDKWWVHSTTLLGGSWQPKNVELSSLGDYNHWSDNSQTNENDSGKLLCPRDVNKWGDQRIYLNSQNKQEGFGSTRFFELCWYQIHLDNNLTNLHFNFGTFIQSQLLII